LFDDGRGYFFECAAVHAAVDLKVDAVVPPAILTDLT